MGRWIVASQGRARPEKKDHERPIRRAQRDTEQKQREQNQLHDKHSLAPEHVGEAAQNRGTDQYPEERGRAHDPLLRGGQTEILMEERNRHPRHENDHSFEKLSGGRQGPDPLLHAGHRRIGHFRAVLPERRFVDVSLDGLFLRVLRVVWFGFGRRTLREVERTHRFRQNKRRNFCSDFITIPLPQPAPLSATQRSSPRTGYDGEQAGKDAGKNFDLEGVAYIRKESPAFPGHPRHLLKVIVPQVPDSHP